MTIQWWRSWHGAPMDAKWLVISNRSGVKPGIVSAIAWELCDFASQNEERGSVKGFDVEVYAAFSGFLEDEINAVMKAMREKNFIDKDEFLTNWIKRQPAREDDSRERVNKFREMKRSVTQCNAKISADKDTDKDKEKIKDIPAKPPKQTQKDDRTNSLSIQAFRKVTGKFPPKQLYDSVIEILGDNPNESNMKLCYQAWLSRGYNPSATTWLEWYRDGIPTRPYQKNNQQTPEYHQTEKREVNGKMIELPPGHKSWEDFFKFKEETERQAASQGIKL